MKKSKTFICYKVFVFVTFHVIVSSLVYKNKSYCRDRLGYFTEHDFKLTSCSTCYAYLIKNNPAFNLTIPLLTASNTSLHDVPILLIDTKRTTVFPTHDNETAVELVCDTLNDEECSRWTDCCRAAWDCCLHQNLTEEPVNVADVCPETWDGWYCFDYTPVGTTTTGLCPGFLEQVDTSALISKQCNSDGSWFRLASTNLEKSDYSQCVLDGKENFQLTFKTTYVGIAFNSLGIVMVVLAIVIFLNYRLLRLQQRIRIHLNLLGSLLLSGVANFIWDLRVTYDRLVHSPEDSFLHSQEEICKFLNVFSNFSRATVFFWMFCEGLYLHRLMVNAFIPPRNLTVFIVIGWCVPVFLYIIYAVLRATIANNSICWTAQPDGAKVAIEWVIVFIPNILCIACNLLFMINILRIICRRIVSNTHEPRSFRRTLKAIIILIPLFGIHQFCLIYNITTENQTVVAVFEIAKSVINNSQGIVISLIFCYFNGEVQSHLKSTWKYYTHSIRKDSSSRRLSLTFGSLSSRRTSVSSDRGTSQGIVLTDINVRNLAGYDNPGFTENGTVHQNGHIGTKLN